MLARLRLLILLFCLSISFIGCGGGSGGSSVAKTNPRIAIAWPVRGRELSAPGSALSVAITFQDLAGTTTSFQANRPSSSEAATQSYTAPTAIRAGSYLLVARFHADAEATGDIVGMASASVQITKDGEVVKPDGQPLGAISFTGGVATVLLYEGLPFDPGETRDLFPVIYSISELLTLSPESFHLDVTSGSDVVRVNHGINVTALTEGTAMLVLTVDGKASEPLTLTVNGPALTPRGINLVTNALCYDATREKIWASLPLVDGIADIDPATGVVGVTVSAGSQPSALGLSDDASTLFVGLNGDHTIRPVDLNSRLAGQSFAVTSAGGYPQDARRIAVQPGSNSTVAITTSSAVVSGSYGPQIYDNGVPRANRMGLYEGSELVWTSPSRIVAVSGDLTSYTAFDIAVDAEGATKTRKRDGALVGFATNMIRSQGRIYTSDGTVFDDPTLGSVGRFDGLLYNNPYPSLAAGPVLDLAADRAYFILINELEARLLVYRLSDYRQIHNRALTGVTGPQFIGDLTNFNLLRWGSHGLAFRTMDHVYFLDDISGL